MTGAIDPALVSPIVVGISRRTGSPEALRWAAAEAQLRDTHVLAVTAWRGPRVPASPGGRPPGVSATTAQDAFAEESARLEARLTSAVGDLAGLRISFEVRRGAPAAVLLQAAVGAQLLVLDSPRARGLATVSKSWIAPQVVFRSPCPVVLMPPPDPGGEHLLRERALSAIEATADLAGAAGRPGIRV